MAPLGTDESVMSEAAVEERGEDLRALQRGGVGAALLALGSHSRVGGPSWSPGGGGHAADLDD